MQTIQTKFVGPTNSRGSRVIATAANGTRVSISASMFTSDEEAHQAAVRALCERMRWHGELIGGHLAKGGLVWVFVDGISPRVAIARPE